MDKLNFIENYYFENSESDYIYLILHSLFNCLTEKEIQTFYFENAQHLPALKNTLESYIEKRTINEPKRNFNQIALTLLKEYDNQDNKVQTSTRVFLSKIIRTLPPKTIKIFFYKFINSHRKYDRHRANEISDLIWNDEIEGIILDNFYKYKDEISLLPLVENLDKENLVMLSQKIWKSNFPSNRIKSKILRKTYSLEFENFEFLKEIDNAFYIQILALKKIKIDENEILDLLNDLETVEQKHYLLWSIGISGDWDLTKNYIKKIEKQDVS